MAGMIGIIGLGIMGGAMAANLLERGWRVYGMDVNPDRCAAFRSAGGIACPDVASVCEETPVVLTSLPTPAALHQVTADIAKVSAPHVVIETSTMALSDKLGARDVLARAGHTPLDCTISGTGAQARVRDLVIYASGDPAAIAAQMPLFADISRAAYDLGPYGNGSRMKFVANLLVAIHNVATAEAMVLAAAAGLDPQQVVELVGAGAGVSRVFELRAPMMAQRDYGPPTMRISTWQKDMDVIGAFAREAGLALPLFEACGPVYAEALAAGLGELDTAAVHAVLEKRRGT
jgi:putative dehydrogenase